MDKIYLNTRHSQYCLPIRFRIPLKFCSTFGCSKPEIEFYRLENQPLLSKQTLSTKLPNIHSQWGMFLRLEIASSCFPSGGTCPSFALFQYTSSAFVKPTIPSKFILPSGWYKFLRQRKTPSRQLPLSLSYRLVLKPTVSTHPLHCTFTTRSVCPLRVLLLCQIIKSSSSTSNFFRFPILFE